MPRRRRPAPRKSNTDVAIDRRRLYRASLRAVPGKALWNPGDGLEANRPGWGCSGRNGGFARVRTRPLTARQMIEKWGRDAARRALREPWRRSRRAGLTVGAHRLRRREAGHLKIAHRPWARDASSRGICCLQREFEYPAEYLPRQSSRISTSGVPIARRAASSRRARGASTQTRVRSVLALARSAGAVVHMASPVIRWEKSNAEHWLVTAAREVRARPSSLRPTGTRRRRCIRRCATRCPVLSHIIVTRPLTPTGDERHRLRNRPRADRHPQAALLLAALAGRPHPVRRPGTDRRIARRIMRVSANSC